MTIRARIAKAVRLKEVEPPRYFGLSPEEFRRQCHVCFEATSAAFMSRIKPECPSGINQALFDCAWDLEMSC